MGAYASLLFGNRCKVTTAIALAPQTFLASPFPRFNRKFHRGSYIDLSLEKIYPETDNLVIIGEEELFDIYQLLRLPQSPQLQRLSVPGSHHNVVKYLDDRSLLSKLVHDIVAEKISSYVHEMQPLVASSRMDWMSADTATLELQTQISEAVEAYYNNRLHEARIILESLLETNSGWPALLLVLADIYYRQSEPQRALSCLLQVRKTSSFIDGYEGLLDVVSNQVQQSS